MAQPGTLNATASGASRAHALMVEKQAAQSIYYAKTPDPIPYPRQRERWMVRKDQDRMRPDATNRGHVSRNIIALRSAPRVAKVAKPAQHPIGMKHAWQRKAAFLDAMRAAVNAKAGTTEQSSRSGRAA